MVIGVILLVGKVADAQRFSPLDDSILSFRFQTAKSLRLDTFPIGERLVAVGKLFLGAPYVAGTLDTSAVGERVILNAHSFDCVTFYENALAFAEALRCHNPTKDDLARLIEEIRYRGGRLNYYHSRLHYTIDWFSDNQRKGIILDVTQEIAGVKAVLDRRPINFMTMHRALYEQLVNEREFDSMIAVERQIRERDGFYYIPKDRIKAIESEIHSGDIIGITTNIDGLDCSHTGIAIRMKDKRIHFMHASSLRGEVIISDEPLSAYLTHSDRQTGIIIGRPLDIPCDRPKYEW